MDNEVPVVASLSLKSKSATSGSSTSRNRLYVLTTRQESEASLDVTTFFL